MRPADTTMLLPATIEAAMMAKRATTDSYATATEKNSFHGQYSSDSVIVTLSIALALYNSLEMILLLASTFKRWKGLYFWSMWLCNLGVMLYAVGMMLGYFELCVMWLWKAILDIGWAGMVTCQSLVLYSRLGLLVNNHKLLMAVKWMIVVNSVVLCTSVNVLDFGNTYSGMSSFHKGYYYIEKIQMTLFTIQELFISGLYVWKTLAFLKVIDKSNTRSMIWQLFVINVIIISMDIVIVTMQYLHLQLYQEATKVFVYSVKLKLELNILSKLVDLVHGNRRDRSMTLDIIDSNAIQGQARADVRREISWSDHLSSSIRRDEKSALANIRESPHGTTIDVSSTDQTHNDNNDGIARVFSNQSRGTVRTSGRESDIMYADMLRSMK